MSFINNSNRVIHRKSGVINIKRLFWAFSSQILPIFTPRKVGFIHKDDMYNHAPITYSCPYCSLIQGSKNSQSELKQTDIIVQTADVMAFMATRKYLGNQGHVLIVPNQHFENIYDLPLDILSRVHILGRDVALAMKSEYTCDGITFRQHNEPAGDQNIWHYHLHAIPRYHNDGFHNAQKVPFEEDERARYAQRLRNWFCRSRNINLYML